MPWALATGHRLSLSEGEQGHHHRKPENRSPSKWRTESATTGFSDGPVCRLYDPFRPCMSGRSCVRPSSSPPNPNERVAGLIGVGSLDEQAVDLHLHPTQTLVRLPGWPIPAAVSFTMPKAIREVSADRTCYRDAPLMPSWCSLSIGPRASFSRVVRCSSDEGR